MFKQAKNTSTSLRFKRWSRKSYAVFISLNKAVTIGSLVISVADKSLTKASNHITNILTDLFLNPKEGTDTDFDELETASNNCILQALTIQLRTDAPAAAGAIVIFTCIRATYKGESPRNVALFLSKI